MREVKVTSGHLDTVSHNAGNGVLRINFKDGRIYRFFRVPAHAAQELIDAPSPGAYFNRNIRNRYKFQEVL